MRLVLGTYSTNCDFNGGCDFAEVDLKPTYARDILARMQTLLKLSKSDRALHEAHFWDFHAQYFEAPLDEELDAKLSGACDGHVVLNDQEPFPEELFKRVECMHLVIDVTGDSAEASWRAAPKGTPEYMQTHAIQQSLLEEAAGDANQTPNP